MELVGSHFNWLVHNRKELLQGLFLLLAKLLLWDATEELISHGHKRFLRPAIEPVKRAAVDQRGELARSDSQKFTDRRHAHHDVEVVTEWLNVLQLAILAINWNLLLVQQLSQIVLHPVLVSFLIQASDVTSVQQVIDILEERLIHDLGVVQDEGSRLL